MGIQAADIAKVRTASDIVAIISEHTEVRRSGRQWMARCPLHGERTPSLSVSSEKGVFHCFGCGRSGDVIGFVQEIEKLDFVAAVERLARRAGITLHYTSRDESAARTRKRRLIEAVGTAVGYYHERLLTADDAGSARSYLRGRGYDSDMVRRYRIGWAPDDWDQLARHLGLSGPDLNDAGLGFVNRAGRQQDFFRARVMFPISDERGDPVGFGGRILPGAEGPKYKNTSSEAIVYDKSRVLFGLHQNREEIVRAGQAVICEGYTDVIGLAAAGIEQAVATCGTALTEGHVQLLKRFSADRLVLAFDADAAGQAAAERVYAWEQRHGLDVGVADLPDGVDPADLARSDPARLRSILDEAKPLLGFRVDRILSAANLAMSEGRARAAQAAIEVINEHPIELTRDQYLVALADRCRLRVGVVRRAATGGPSLVKGPGADSDPHVVNRLTPEDEALLLLIRHSDEVAGRLLPCLFADPVRREAFEALSATKTLLEALDLASEEARNLLLRLEFEETEAEVDDVLSGVTRLAADRVMRDLQRSARSAEAEDRARYSEAIGWLKRQSELLGESDTRTPALQALLAWLARNSETRVGSRE